MKYAAKFVASILIITMSVTSVYAEGEMTIVAMDSPENMVAHLLALAPNDGIQVSNVQYTGNLESSGYFSNAGDSGINLNKGIVLTTGKASYAGTSNTSSKTGSNLGNSGDSQLDSLIPGYKTYDATTLSFDFQTDSDSAHFNFVFASEEYTEWVGSSYNDTFGFFVDDVNYAKITDTDIAVSINNVSQSSNSEYFNSNDPWHTGLQSSPYNNTYDGFTDVFTANITGLTPGEVYGIKLGIADAGDHIYDSAVFIEKGSFSSIPIESTPNPEPSTIFLLLIAAMGLFYKYKSDQLGVVS